ncbi:hypothetical protein QBC40DRAFT_287383 [Triangularia verruculosa]|uniref:Uncharacterized protein n=1 Tax=Triangularia verruculosa TaxID=2587418 RepID=A0AAN6XAB0_9PEZI|nr:hypothetical protein QBC40DRAFT_287383 [Triangularia verruculosa]
MDISLCSLAVEQNIFNFLVSLVVEVVGYCYIPCSVLFIILSIEFFSALLIYSKLLCVFKNKK